MPRAHLLIAVLAAGCKRPEAPPAPPAAPSPSAPPAAFDACAGRPGCKLDAQLASGVPGVAVQRLVLPVAPESGDCTPVEHWRIELAAGVPRAGQLLVATCNDGYGAAGVGEDAFSVKEGVFEHAQSGGSNWRWQRTRQVSLAPLRWISDADTSFWTVSPVSERCEVDLRTLAGQCEGERPRCNARGASDDDGARFHYAYAPIPLLDGLPSELSGPLAQAGLGTCALHIDASGAHGYLLKGEPGSPDDARLAVLARDEGTLLIEIEDDLLTGPSARWLVDDHVEVWASTSREGDENCQRGRGKAVQWAIRVADGQVFPAYGKPAPLEAEVLVLDAHRARLRVRFPPYERVSVVYSDGDDGATQERLLATSRLVFGDGATHGKIRRLSARAARCSSGEGALVLGPGDDPPAGQPWLPEE